VSRGCFLCRCLELLEGLGWEAGSRQRGAGRRVGGELEDALACAAPGPRRLALRKAHTLHPPESRALASESPFVCARGPCSVCDHLSSAVTVTSAAAACVI